MGPVWFAPRTHAFWTCKHAYHLLVQHQSFQHRQRAKAAAKVPLLGRVCVKNSTLAFHLALQWVAGGVVAEYAHAQLKSCLPPVYLWHHSRDNLYQAFLSLILFLGEHAKTPLHESDIREADIETRNHLFITHQDRARASKNLAAMKRCQMPHLHVNFWHW